MKFVVKFLSTDEKTKRYITVTAKSEEDVKEKMSFMADKIISIRPATK